MSKTLTDEKAESTVDRIRYRAPALEKGLEILEFMAVQTSPMTLSNISQELNRSRSEIFRMVQELEIRGYIKRSIRGEGYEITNKLFLLGGEQPRTHVLLEAALPVMHEFANTTRQSCHIAVQADELIVVIACMEAPVPVSLCVKVGHHQALVTSTSGPVIFAYQSSNVQEAWISRCAVYDPSFSEIEFRRQARKIFKQGYFMKESSYIRGVTDLSAPIFRQGVAVAAFTAPCTERYQSDFEVSLPVNEVKRAAEEISTSISTR